MAASMRLLAGLGWGQGRAWDNGRRGGVQMGKRRRSRSSSMNPLVPAFEVSKGLWKVLWNKEGPCMPL